jgi:hypothetical protein
MFEMLKKQILANFQTKKLSLSSQNMGLGSGIRDPGSEIRDPRSGIRDPGSEKNLFRIPDPGVNKAPYPGSGSATLLSGFILEGTCIE